MLRRIKGFTLTELMITVALVGILGAIAYPSYLDQVRKSRRTDAQAALINLAGLMEQHYSRNNTYANASIGTGTANDVLSSSDTPEDWYTLSIIAQTATSYTIQASPKGDQVNDVQCGTLSMDSVGTKSVSGTGTTRECW